MNELINGFIDSFIHPFIHYLIAYLQVTGAGFTASAMLYTSSHLLVLFERHLAGFRPPLHAQLVSETTAILGLSALWIYSILVSSIPLFRCIVNPGFGTGYAFHVVAHFVCQAVASALLAASVLGYLRQTPAEPHVNQIRRCLLGLAVSSALWTPSITFHLLDQLGGKTSATGGIDKQEISVIFVRQMAPLVGLSTALLMPLVYSRRCPLRHECCTSRQFSVT